MGAITVTGVNDAPVNTVPGAQTVAEDTVLQFGATSPQLSIADVDAGAGTLTTTLSAAHALELTALGKTFGSQYATVLGSGSPSMTLTGSLAEINATLATVAYEPLANFNGSDTLTMTTSDGGNTGGGALSDTDTVAITVTAVNDAPQVGGAGNTVGYTEQAGAITLDSAITVSDPDSATLTGATVRISAGLQSGDTLHY